MTNRYLSRYLASNENDTIDPRATVQRHHERHMTGPVLTPLDEIERLERELYEARIQRDEARATLDEIRRLTQ